MYAIKAEVTDPEASTFVFSNERTMYGGKRIAAGDYRQATNKIAGLTPATAAFLRSFF
jgi:hypothetical protein